MKFLSQLFGRKPPVSHSRGFTLIELLIVLAIFIIITAVVLASQNRFSSDILLTDLAYQVAISIRQAQVYGLGVRGATSNFNLGYGVNFSSAPATTYKFFADANEDGIGEITEVNALTSTTFQIQRGEKISKVCGIDAGNNAICVGQGVITALNIIYIRPNPAAIITSAQTAVPVQNDDGSYQLPPIGAFNEAIITVVSGLGDRYKCITVYQTGQVSVSNATTTAGNPCPQ